MQPLRVLICDPHDPVRIGLAALLNQDPAVRVVSLIKHPRDVAAAIAETEPGLVLMDLGTPGLQGLEVTRWLATNRPDLPVVVMSMSNDSETAAAAIAAGAVAFLDKARVGVQLSKELRRLSTLRSWVRSSV